jgi:molybdopterin molybdotransferase
MIAVKDALARILESAGPIGLERLDIMSARGRIVGEDIFSGRDIPPFDNSSMDGFALRAADTAGASPDRPVELTVIEDIPAGHLAKKKVGPGQASRIMTGAFLPEGADSILRVEDTESAGDRVKIFVQVDKGNDVRLRGEDVKMDEKVIAKGSLIRPAEIGMLAALGRSFVSVYQAPVVSVLSTGDELTDIDGDVSQGRIVSSNSYSLAALVKECGSTLLQMGIARDTREDLSEKFQACLRADIIISSGGVSVGDYDFVKDVIRSLGAIDFWKVAMRPGRPLAFGKLGEKLLFGLPGNPVSAMISFEQFVRPAILKMSGHKRIFRRTIRATLQETIKKKSGLKYFLRGIVSEETGRFVVRSTGEQGSGILKSMVMANCLVILPEDRTAVKKGEEVIVQVLDDSFGMTADPEILIP